MSKIKNDLDILMLSETKFDDSFPIGQFHIEGFSTPIRLDRNITGGGIMLFSREGIPIKLLSLDAALIESFYVEINLRKKKRVLNCSYNPDKSNISMHLSALRKSLDLYSTQYENFVTLGDFNVEVDDNCMKDFCKSYNLKSLVLIPTCFKNPENMLCIDLILTNSPYSIQSSCVIEIDLSDFHKMTVAVMKASFQKMKPKIITYKNYKLFSNELYKEDLVSELSNESLQFGKLKRFLKICGNTLNRHAARKKKFIRGNHSPFTIKEL